MATGAEIAISITFAVIGSIVINILPYVNIKNLQASEIPPVLSNAQFTFGLIALILLGVLIDVMYCMDGEAPNHWNSLCIGASAPSIIMNLLTAFNKNSGGNDQNQVG